MQKLYYYVKNHSERVPAKVATQTAGLIGCTLMGAAAAGMAMSGAKIDGLLNNSSGVVDSRRSSTPNTSIGSSFSSIFSLKSVMSAASKTPPTAPIPAAPVVAPSTSNFYVPQPVADTVVVSSQTEQLKTVQGIN